MKREKRVIACLLAIIMMITAVPDMHLMADEGTTETGSEWLSFESKNTENGVEVTINKNQKLKESNAKIYYRYYLESKVNNEGIQDQQTAIKKANEYSTPFEISGTVGESQNYIVEAVAEIKVSSSNITADEEATIFDNWKIANGKVWDENNEEVSNWSVDDNDTEGTIVVTTTVFSERVTVGLIGSIKDVTIKDMKSVSVNGSFTKTVKIEGDGIKESTVNVTWKKKTDENKYEEIDDTIGAEYNTEYQASIKLQAKEYYQFVSEDQITVNGLEGITGTVAKSVSNNNTTLTITWTYTTGDRIFIKKVNISEIEQPVAGKGFPTKITINADGIDEQQSILEWTKLNGEKVLENEIAQPKVQYIATIIVKSDTNHKFDKETTEVSVKSIGEKNIDVTPEYLDQDETLKITWKYTTKPLILGVITPDEIVCENGNDEQTIKDYKLPKTVTSKVWSTGEKPKKLEDADSEGTITVSEWKLADGYTYDEESTQKQILTYVGKLEFPMEKYDVVDNIEETVSITVIVKAKPVLTNITTFEIFQVANGTSLDAIIAQLPNNTTANVNDNGTNNNVNLKIIWDKNGITNYDPTSKQQQTITVKGTLTTGDGVSVTDKYVIADGVNLSVTIRIIVSAVNDTTAPVITGIENGKTYCQSKTFTVFDENLKSVTINGIDQGKNGSYTLAAGASYTIIASDVLDHTTTVTIVINQGHTWDSGKITQNATDKKEGIYTYSCTYCDSKKQSIIPRKSITVKWGKKLKLSDLISDTTGFEKVTVSNASKYKKYFAVDSKKGTVKTTVTAKTKIKKSIPVKLVLNGNTYTVNVKIKIPAPKVTISKKDLGNSYRYTFKYNIKGATKIKVRCKEINANTLFDKYLSKSKSNKDSYVICAKNKMKKYKNKLTFTITAYYGKNISETYEIRK